MFVNQRAGTINGRPRCIRKRAHENRIGEPDETMDGYSGHLPKAVASHR